MKPFSANVPMSSPVTNNSLRPDWVCHNVIWILGLLHMYWQTSGLCSMQPQGLRIMFPFTTINIRGFKYCRDSEQQVILGYLAPPSVDIKSYFLFDRRCRHFDCCPGNAVCLVTHTQGMSEREWDERAFDRWHLKAVSVTQNNHPCAESADWLILSILCITRMKP